MLKRMIILGLSFVLLGLCVAQLHAVEPLVHEKKIYVDSTTQRLYWPMDFRFWVRLSPSPDENAPSYLLQRITTLENTEKDKAFTEGFELEITGKQFMRWVNYYTNEESLLKFFADGDAPITQDSLFGANYFQANGIHYFGPNLQGEILAEDVLSGVEQVYISLDDRPFQPYQNRLTFHQEKEYQLRYYAVDRTGYASEPQLQKFTVDLTPPSVRHKIHGMQLGNAISENTKIELLSEDALSGVKAVYYKFDDQEQYRRYTGTMISLKPLADGQHTLHYYAVDNVENSGKSDDAGETFGFYLDRTPPTVSIAVLGDQYLEGEKFFVSLRSEIQLEAEDNQAGVKFIKYGINQDRILGYTEPFNIRLGTGPFQVSYFAEDKFGNVSRKEQKRFYMDEKMPESQYRIEGNFYRQRSTIWIPKESKLYFSAKDNESGLQKIEYQISKKGIQEYDYQPIQREIEDNYLVRFWGVDNVNNREDDNVILLIIDNTPPEIQAIFSVKKIDTIVEDGRQMEVYPQYTTLFLAALDKASGIKNVWYTLDNRPEQEYHDPIFCKDTGNHEVTIRVEDNVGHTTQTTVYYNIRAIGDIEE